MNLLCDLQEFLVQLKATIEGNKSATLLESDSTSLVSKGIEEWALIYNCDSSLIHIFELDGAANYVCESLLIEVLYEQDIIVCRQRVSSSIEDSGRLWSYYVRIVVSIKLKLLEGTSFGEVNAALLTEIERKIIPADYVMYIIVCRHIIIVEEEMEDAILLWILVDKRRVGPLLDFI